MDFEIQFPRSRSEPYSVATYIDTLHGMCMKIFIVTVTRHIWSRVTMWVCVVHKDIAFTPWEVSFTSALCNHNRVLFIFLSWKTSKIELFLQNKLDNHRGPCPIPQVTHQPLPLTFFSHLCNISRAISSSGRWNAHPHLYHLCTASPPLASANYNILTTPLLTYSHSRGHSVTFTGYRHDEASTPTSSSSPTKLWTILHPHTWLISCNTSPPPATCQHSHSHYYNYYYYYYYCL